MGASNSTQSFSASDRESALIDKCCIDYLHPYYCEECSRGFQDENSFRFHLASKRHAKPSMVCPQCGCGFVSAAGLVKHVEMSSTCYRNLRNNQIVEAVRRWEAKSARPNLFTVPCIEWNDNNNETIICCKSIATEASFNGTHYVCPVCNKKFTSLWSLNQHLDSNVHEPFEFRCKKCSKKFKDLSALVAHVESGACGAMAPSAMQSFIDSFKSVLRIMY
ncbi:hypothetical protein L7F22_018479 [Adiantum nelumboides]|nr:hypothetical protein [Adiantum nelumboides]